MERTFSLVLFCLFALLAACQPLSPQRQNGYGPQPAIDCQKPAVPPAPAAGAIPGTTGTTTTTGGAQVPPPYTPVNPASGGSLLLANYGVTYEVEMKPILDRCTGCHGNAGGVSLSTYANAKANGPASLNSVRAKRMPPSGPLSPAEIATFEQWAAGGYAGGGTGGVTGGTNAGSTGGTSGGINGGVTSPTLPPSTGSVIYEDHIRPLFANYCQSCHTAAANRATFDTYDDVRRSFSMVMTRITLQAADPKRMPKGKPSLDAGAINLLRTWQSLNFPVRNSGTSGGSTSGLPYPPPTGGTKPPC